MVRGQAGHGPRQGSSDEASQGRRAVISSSGEMWAVYARPAAQPTRTQPGEHPMREKSKFPMRDMKAAYGEKVSCYPSSAATRKCCWIKIDTAENKNDGAGGRRVEATAHLTEAQARKLRDSLTEFLDSP